VRSLLLFIIRFHAFFLFLILSTLSVWLISREKDFQRSGIINSARSMVGGVHKTRNNIVDYFHLRRINDSLHAENARLRMELDNAWYLDTAHFITVRDSVRDTLADLRMQHYRYIAARVISNSVHRFDNYLTLLAGSSHGVKPGMGVIGPDGVVGIVREVGTNMSRAFSLLHHQVSIPAKLKSAADQGRVRWQGTNPEIGYLVDIGQHVKVHRGDTIITSGFSTVFPADVMVGTVEDYKVNHGTGFLEIEVRLSSDFSRLEYVYIVENLLAEEQQTLESEPK
jgi:rod shape-determining protein MreC